MADGLEGSAARLRLYTLAWLGVGLGFGLGLGFRFGFGLGLGLGLGVGGRVRVHALTRSLPQPHRATQLLLLGFELRLGSR